MTGLIHGEKTIMGVASMNSDNVSKQIKNLALCYGLLISHDTISSIYRKIFLNVNHEM